MLTVAILAGGLATRLQPILKETPKSLINICGKPFIDWCITEKKESVNKLFETAYVIADYSSKLEGATDPLILGITIIGKFRDILKNPV
jgi:NDP-sugar pyrophosphorylase family protein